MLRKCLQKYLCLDSTFDAFPVEQNKVSNTNLWIISKICAVQVQGVDNVYKTVNNSQSANILTLSFMVVLQECIHSAWRLGVLTLRLLALMFFFTVKNNNSSTVTTVHTVQYGTKKVIVKEPEFPFSLLQMKHFLFVILCFLANMRYCT